MIFGESITTDGTALHVQQAIGLEEWGKAVELLSGLSVASPWWIGDLLNYGELEYGEDYAQGIPEGLSLSTIKGYMWVSEHVAPDNRRPTLSWSHHKVVAACDSDKQATLLEQAEDEGWSVAELRRQVKGQDAPEKAKVYKVGISDYESEFIVLATDEAEDIGERLSSGKRVTLEC